MFSFDAEKIYKSDGHFKRDKNLLTGSAPEAAPMKFSSIGYEYIYKVCCRKCAAEYIKENIGNRNYIIIPLEDQMFNSTDLIFPQPVLWKGDPEVIIQIFNSIGFDVYYSGNEKETIILIPKFFKIN